MYATENWRLCHVVLSDLRTQCKWPRDLHFVQQIFSIFLSSENQIESQSTHERNNKKKIQIKFKRIKLRISGTSFFSYSKRTQQTKFTQKKNTIFASIPNHAVCEVNLQQQNNERTKKKKIIPVNTYIFHRLKPDRATCERAAVCVCTSVNHSILLLVNALRNVCGLWLVRTRFLCSRSFEQRKICTNAIIDVLKVETRHT